MRGRPLWHRGAGFLTAVAGVGLIIFNYAEELGSRVLPGGHQEAYFALGMVIALTSSWWFGLFDRPGGKHANPVQRAVKVTGGRPTMPTARAAPRPMTASSSRGR